MQPPLKILVRLTPKARRTAFLGWSEDAEGRRVLKASVTAAPEKGKANAALIALLAGHWRIPKSAIRIEQGETSRTKTLILSQIPENIE
jgi:uncharacterized protein YggU (UPF0235/DUF167 family)